MKRTAFPLLVVCCLFITFFSCSNQSNRSRKPVSNISFQPNKKSYVFGESVSVNVKTKVKNGEIKSIKLFYNNGLVKESKDLEFSVENVVLEKLGSAVFRVEAVKTDSVENSRTKIATVVSNIEPKKMTYQVVDNFPHSKKHYTQGLEIHNGILYEGTGEYGASGLFKINLETGKVLRKRMLDKKYFGEGITILNEKIYQVTYHAQKGFVYQVSDFALIDSFSYRSKEGWGLTNDGTNLIMSNGTQKLAWLDPNDFSVTKTLEVANNLGIVNYLNELEFIDGTIYANVYTTDLVVQIDPETGKVLAQINLGGILNMYKNANDTIDYLNGIAYDKKADRLFVTGKYWPRLFEIKLLENLGN